MNKILIFACLISLVGCNLEPYRDEAVLTEMKSPVVIIGKNPVPLKDGGTASVTFKDATGRFFTSSETYLSIALSSRNIGDTIK